MAELDANAALAEPSVEALGDAVTIVIPTVGRSSLDRLLAALATEAVPCRFIVIDDRPAPATDLAPIRGAEGLRVEVLRSAGNGPAAARNLGWRHARTPWVAFLDDDVLPAAGWARALARDLLCADAGVDAVQGRLSVPLPADRRPTDWERVTAGLAHSQWITADMAYRRDALVRVGGFDERFRRAFREDSDLAIRVRTTGGDIDTGQRSVLHPVRPAGFWVSVKLQAGNADDMLMRRLHGRRWRDRSGAPKGRRPRHVVTTAALATAVGTAALGRRRAAAVAGLTWCALTAEFAVARILPGPRTTQEVARMAVTSAVIPPLATWHTLAGAVRHRRAHDWCGAPDLLLFDRDGTLVVDVPYNADPDRAVPMPGAAAALARARAAGVKVGIITNQSGVGRGTISEEELLAVNARVEQLLGPFDTWQICRHTPEAGCSCRKPGPALVTRACRQLGVPANRCVVIGDIGSDVLAAQAAGARSMLVPTAVTRSEEVAAAPVRLASLGEAVATALEGIEVTRLEG